MYGKIFESIFDSSLAVEGDFITIYVFSSLIVLADEHGFVNIGPDALYEKLKFPNDFVIKQEFLRSIALLEAPDEKSNLRAEEGKRIIPLSDIDEIPENRGWWIVNYLYYRDKANQDERKQARREYMKNYMNRQRSSDKKTNKNNDVNSRKQVLTPVSKKPPYTDTDTDTDTDTYKQNIWLDKEVWEDYRKHRKQLKAPMTERAEQLAVKKLRKLSQHESQRSVVDRSIENGWKGLFEGKETKKSEGQRTDSEFIRWAESRGIRARPGESMEAFRLRANRQMERQ